MESEGTDRKQPGIYEKDLKFKVDFELPLTNGIYGNSLRFGAKYASKTKDRNTLCYDYADAYKDAFDKDYMNNLTSQIRDGYMPGDQYKATDFVSKEYLAHSTSAVWKANRCSKNPPATTTPVRT